MANRNAHFKSGYDYSKLHFLDEGGTVVHDDDGVIGQLHITFPADEEGKFEIRNIWVSPRHQRKGIATEMKNRVEAAGYPLKHSTTITEEGKKWAEAVG